MPPRKSTQNKQLAAAAGRESMQRAREALSQNDYISGIREELREAKSTIATLETGTSALETEDVELRSTNHRLRSTITELRGQLKSEKERTEYHRKASRISRQQCGRQEKQIRRMRETIRKLKEVDASQRQWIRTLSTDYKDAIAVKRQLEMEKEKLMAKVGLAKDLGREVEERHKKSLALVSEKLANVQRRVSTLKKRDDRAVGVLKRSVDHTTKTTLMKATTYRLLEKGVFTEEVRDLVRYLFRIGVPGYRINEVIHTCGKLFRITVVGTVSRTSVARFIREGGVAAGIQMGFELSNAESFTMSADGTGHRAINYNSRHINLKVEDYTSGEVDHRTRFLGVMPSLDGSSAESIKDYDKALRSVCDLFNRSPFGQRQRMNPLRVVDILVKLTGMHTDHCAKEKKDVEALRKLKEQSVHQVLGEQAVVDGEESELLPYFVNARKTMIKTVGGTQAWDQLSEEKQAERNAEMLHGIVMEIGKESLELMSHDEKRVLKLFIWAGCGCHKELNTVRGGYTEMTKYYQEDEAVPKPVALANRDNSAVLADITSEDDIENEVQARAFEKTERGAIKCAQLAGAIFNNKLDKKGHHDVFRWWWKSVVGTTFTFPDTSNTRFGSYCEAAIVLIVHLDHFKDFLLFIKEKKDKYRWSHMEENLWNALNDTPTLCELIILGLYAESIGIPYIIKIRLAAKEKVNMLDMGPLHTDVYNHMRCLAQNPAQLLVEDLASHLTTVLYGDEWRNKDFIVKAWSMASTLPHILPLLSAFFTGACATWKRFTSEFAPGGLIDEATQEEKELAWLVPTNDVNEGALGSFRVTMRRQPQLSLIGYNAQAMYIRNDTQAFMQKFFVKPEDLQFVHAMARESSGEDRKRQKEITDHARARAVEKVSRRRLLQQQKQQKELRIQQLELILDKEALPQLKGEKLKDMLDKFKEVGAPNMEQVKRSSKVGDIRAALASAIDDYHNGDWRLPGGDAPQVGFDNAIHDWDDYDSEDSDGSLDY